MTESILMPTKVFKVFMVEQKLHDLGENRIAIFSDKNCDFKTIHVCCACLFVGLLVLLLSLLQI